MFDTEQWVNETLMLARELGLMPELVSGLETLITADFLRQHEADCHALTAYPTAENSWKQLSDHYKEIDPDGLHILGLMLAAACITRRNYARLGIEDAIFRDTMACFPRFLREDYIHAGKICFTRGFWAWRQLSGRLFRLGTLEFEYRNSANLGEKLQSYTEGRMLLSVHIPSDAVMTDEALRQSYTQARSFFREHEESLCPEGAPSVLFCSTWLLSPTLYEILPAGSRIRRFASDYTLYEVDPGNTGFYFWLFNGETELEKLPQESSLQKKVWEYLAAGGEIGSAAGVITM